MNRTTARVCLLVCLFAGLPVTAAETAEDPGLPIHLTPEEKLRLHEIGVRHVTSSPPAGVVRNPAEWEPSEGVIVRWPLGIPVSLVAEMSEDVLVTTIVQSSQSEQSASNTYAAGGVNMANVGFVHAPTNTIYTRDYGPWFIFEDDRLAIVDHIYNRPRPLDDVIPQVIGTEWGLDVYGMDLIHTGGNHMSDGLGMSASTKLVYYENPTKTQTQVHDLMRDYLGNEYTVLDYIQSGGIHHIDCWAKFVGPSTVLVKDVSSSDPTHEELNARAEFLSQQISPWGVPYEVLRVYCPSGTWYTNSLILNDKVLVPLFGNGQDSVALDTYRDAMPGYEVLGFQGSWAPEDALHCRTMGVPDRGMLLIDHVPYRTEDITNGDYEIRATIVPHSGQLLVPDQLRVYYSAEGGYWYDAPLTAGQQPDEYQGIIPAQAEDSTVAYYLEAADESGRLERHPYVGREWAHEFTAICPSHPTVNVSPDGSLVVCAGSGRLLTAELDGGTGPFAYQWTEDGFPIPGATSGSYTAGGSGTHHYNCRVWGDGCVNPRTDVEDVELTWQNEPVFAGLGEVTNTQSETCTLQLTWDAATPACAGPVRYRVYRSTDVDFTPGAENLVADGLASVSHADSEGLLDGTRYYYVVRAVDDSNGAEDGNTIVDVAIPGGPGGGPCTTGGSGSPVVTVPDGSEGGTTPLLAANQGLGLSVVWDAQTAGCASTGYHLVWGWGSQIDSYTVAGSDCSLDASGTHSWVFAPDTSSDWAWFLVLGDDGASTEGGWGTDSSGNERSSAASGECGTLAIEPTACLP